MTRPTDRPLVSADEDPLFSADDVAHPSGVVAQRRAQITVGEVEEITRRSEEARPFAVPDVQTYGTVEKMTVQTDRQGAVLVAYTTDAETGQVTRSSLRFNHPGIAYILRRLSPVGP
ncbi:hypothetical protein ACFYVL_43880 [Streptomyces sp. NPDC004111]|uniref:hypothetical protein n=1 Tax=Streptomyces sp. NPDC004111 TaxID=3364690 RepID=UPI0036CE7E26